MEYNCLACAFFLKNQVDTSCISQEFLYKLFFDLTNQQLTCTPVHLVLGIFCIPLKDRERTHALLLNPPEFSMGGATQSDPYVTTFQRCSLKSGRSNMTEMLNRSVCQDDVTGLMF